MHWGSAAEFFAMGGYAFYVWGAYLVTAVALAAEVWLLVRRRRTLRRDLGPKMDMES
ncbi:MAG TPA: heme exporter protein CcmD [Burkholderiales bacterium]|nr:heme exporter protein CcmD [Burkholderiales bacterium]